MQGFEAVRLAAAGEYPIPPSMQPVVNGFLFVHMYYNTFRQGRMFSKIDAGSRDRAIVLGAGLHLAEKVEKVRYAVDFLILAKCTAELTEKYRKITVAFDEYSDVMNGRHPIFIPVNSSLSQGFAARILSPYLLQRIDRKMRTIARKIQLLGIAIFILWWRCFEASMCLRDAYLVAARDPRARFEACTELVVRCAEYEKELENDIVRIYEELQSLAQSVDRISNEFLGSVIGLSDLLSDFKGFAAGEVRIVKEEAGEAIKTFYHAHALPPMQIRFNFTKESEQTREFGNLYWRGEIDTAESLVDPDPRPPEKIGSQKPGFRDIFGGFGKWLSRSSR